MWWTSGDPRWNTIPYVLLHYALPCYLLVFSGVSLPFTCVACLLGNAIFFRKVLPPLAGADPVIYEHDVLAKKWFMPTYILLAVYAFTTLSLEHGGALTQHSVGVCAAGCALFALYVHLFRLVVATGFISVRQHLTLIAFLILYAIGNVALCFAVAPFLDFCHMKVPSFPYSELVLSFLLGAVSSLALAPLLVFTRREYIKADVKTCAVIGGGWSGIYAARYLVKEGIRPCVYEAQSRHGGVWNLEATCVTARNRTRTTISTHHLEAADLKFEEHVPLFCVPQECWRYLERYCEKYDLFKYFKFNSKVLSIEKNDKETSGRWTITVMDTESNIVTMQKFDSVIFATGVTGESKKIPDVYNGFAGTVVHSKNVDFACMPEDARVLVIGNGETAFDLAAEAVEGNHPCALALTRPQYVINRVNRLGPADLVTAPGWRDVLIQNFPMWELFLFRPYAKQFTTNFRGINVPDWEPKTQFSAHFMTKSMDDVVPMLHRGDILPRGKIVKFEGNIAHFTFGSPLVLDYIIVANGYQFKWPEIVGHGNPDRRRWHLVLDVTDPTLGYVGVARPIIGSIPACSEAGAQLLAAVFARKLAIPNARSQECIVDDYKFDVAHVVVELCTHSNLLVNFPVYTANLWRETGHTVNWISLLLTRPVIFFYAFMGTWLAAKFVLDDPDPVRRKEAEEHVRTVAMRSMYRQSNLIESFFVTYSTTAIIFIIVGMLFHVPYETRLYMMAAIALLALPGTIVQNFYYYTYHKAHDLVEPQPSVEVEYPQTRSMLLQCNNVLDAGKSREAKT